MAQVHYPPELVAEGIQLLNIIESVSQDKQQVVKMITEAFINGMEAQKRLNRMECQSPALDNK